LSLYNWGEAKKGLLQKLRRDAVISNAPWIVKPIIRTTKRISLWFNKIIGFRKGLIDLYAYEKLFNSHIKLFGQSDHQKRWIACKKQLIKLRTQRIITGDKFLENYIAIEEQKLLDLDPEKIKGMTTDQALSVLAKFQGVAVIHKKDITVAEYENLMTVYVRATSKKE
jgi:hypothetical protein